MKKAGTIDSVGRIVIPVSMRKMLNISTNDPIEIFVEGNCIVLKKQTDLCVFCGATDGLLLFEKKYVCFKCYEKLCMKPIKFWKTPYENDSPEEQSGENTVAENLVTDDIN